MFAPKADHEGKGYSKSKHHHQRKANRRFVNKDLNPADDQNELCIKRVQVKEPLRIKLHEARVAPNQRAENPGELR